MKYGYPFRDGLFYFCLFQFFVIHEIVIPGINIFPAPPEISDGYIPLAGGFSELFPLFARLGLLLLLPAKESGCNNAVNEPDNIPGNNDNQYYAYGSAHNDLQK
jgi:hypothetical protein